MPCEFTAERLAQIAQMERRHFWFQGRWELVRRLIASHWPDDGRPVADLGCGTGLTLERISRSRPLSVGLDLRLEGIAALKHRRPEARLALSETSHLPLPASRFGGVLMLDVLEHVDDLSALREVAKVLGAGGVLIASVPAWPWLWSRRDVDAGHRRRYTPRAVRSAVAAAGLRLKCIMFYQFFLFPFLVISRLAGRGSGALRDREDAGLPPMNAPLAALARMEARLSAAGVRWPVGSSIIFVAEAVSERPDV